MLDMQTINVDTLNVGSEMDILLNSVMSSSIASHPDYPLRPIAVTPDSAAANHYPDDDAAAMSVLQHMKKQGRDVSILNRNNVGCIDRGMWRVVLSEPGSGLGYYAVEAFAPTLALAIYRAAIKAVFNHLACLTTST
jgi:hypothetical protein